VDINSSAFLDITLHRPLETERLYGGTYRFLLHGRRINHAKTRMEQVASRAFFGPENGGDMFF
jgi:hypothetical protein